MIKVISLFLMLLIGTAYASPGIPSFKAIQTGEKTYSVYLASDIAPSDYYMNLIMLMVEKQPTDLDIYLSGYGGRLDAIQDILSIKNKFNVKFHAHIYGSVYSAHAMLALNSDTIEAYNDYLMIMVHQPASGNDTALEACNRIWFYEKDRGQSAKEKCIQQATGEVKVFNSLVLSKIFAVLNKEEQKQYYQGKDVYLTWKQLKTRLGVK